MVKLFQTHYLFHAVNVLWACENPAAGRGFERVLHHPHHGGGSAAVQAASLHAYSGACLSDIGAAPLEQENRNTAHWEDDMYLFLNKQLILGNMCHYLSERLLKQFE